MEKTYTIKSKFGKKLFSFKCGSFSLCVEIAIALKKDLRFANLSSANLSSADLSSADLSFANLDSADLSFANLGSADLRSANLRSADLSFANLGSADLRSANLRSADLSFANLGSADLRSANLRSADLSFANLDFSCLPLWCGGLNFKADSKIITQLMYHIASITKASGVEIDERIRKVIMSDEFLSVANKIHRDDVKKIKK